SSAGKFGFVMLLASSSNLPMIQCWSRQSSDGANAGHRHQRVPAIAYPPMAGPAQSHLTRLAPGRIYIVLAALLWSPSGAFTKVLTQPTFVGADEPPIAALHWDGKDYPVQLACYRALFAGLVLLTMLRRADLSFRPLMIVMAVCFAL